MQKGSVTLWETENCKNCISTHTALMPRVEASWAGWYRIKEHKDTYWVSCTFESMLGMKYASLCAHMRVYMSVRRRYILLLSSARWISWTRLHFFFQIVFGYYLHAIIILLSSSLFVLLYCVWTYYWVILLSLANYLLSFLISYLL